MQKSDIEYIDNMNTVLTIIVTYNSMEWIDRCLSSVMASSVPSDIIVIDNLSKDETVSHIRTNYPDVILVESKENLGFGKGNNVGLRYALEKGYEYVYLLNQDAWVEPDTYEKMVAVNKERPEYGMLSPMQMHPDMDRYERLFDRLVIRWIASEMERDLAKGCLKEVYPVRYVQAAHWMISRECIEKAGIFSPVFPHYGEDDNYCQRVLYHGMKIGLVTAAKAVHDADNKPNETKAQRNRRFYVKCLLSFSNINNTSRNVWWPVLIESLKDAIRFRTFDAIGMYLKAIRNMKEIRRCLEISRHIGAFINE